MTCSQQHPIPSPIELEQWALDCSPAALRALAEILNGKGEKALRDALVETLKELAERGSVTPLYELWCITREPRLTALLTERGYVPGFASHMKVFRCLESGDLDTLVHGTADLVPPLVKALENHDEVLRERAFDCLGRLRDEDALDTLCALWAHRRADRLRKLIERGKIVARRPPAVMVLSALACGRTDVIRRAGADVVQPLIDACSDEDEILAQRARDCLPRLEDREAVDTFADIWAHNRSELLDPAITEGGYVASKPAIVRVLSALKNDRLEIVTDDGPTYAYSLILALEDTDPVVVQRAETAIDALAPDKDFQDALCRVVIEHGLTRARDIALSRGCKPFEGRFRALFYFLTEQWDEYESLDFDMSIMTEFYEHGGKDLRSRIAATARRAGRLELVELVAGVRHRRRMGEMTIREWEVTLGIVDDRRDWSTLWRLAQTAPAVWSVRALRRLDEVAWLPERREDWDGFDRLRTLALHCVSEAPILGVVDEPFAAFTAHGRRVSRLIVSSYFESVLASAGWDGTVRLWAISDGTLVNKWAAHRHPVTALATNPDGSMLASGCGAEDRVVLWTTQDGEPSKVLTGHVKGVACLAMSPDGRLLAAGCYDGTCRLWRMRDGTLLTTLGADTRSVRSAVFSPDGTVLATGGEDAAVKLWSVPRGELLAVLRGHSMTVRSLVFTPDGAVIAGGSSDNDVILWNSGDGTMVRKLTGHSNVVTSLAISNDGRVLASAGWDRSVRLWVMPEGTPWGILEGHSGPVTCLTTDPESRILVSGSHDCSVMMWNFQSGIFRRPTTRRDMDRLESSTHKPANQDEQHWLDFLIAQMKWRRRFDIEIDAAPARIEIGRYDIEIQG
ncbi:MAG: HEAT repeat domain-containing protein [Desulfomonilaceae bacterium]|nr:HEAT repeat domain-containing protein [Desulfomonilaceae bacterium]